METNSPTDEPTADSAPETAIETPSEPTAEPPQEPAAELPAAADEPMPATDDTATPDELTQLAEASQKARLAPLDEERLGSLLKEALLGGRAGVARAVEVMPKVPWIVGVRAVEATWPELSAGFRTQLLAGLGKDESDSALRMRLSLARALFRIDVPVALKMAVGVVKEMRDKETGTLAPKQAQIFANVFIGRARPWLAQVPLAELKPADADMLAHCALFAAFTVPHPPVTQLGILMWAQENGRLAKLPETTLEAVKRGVGRWSGKWQGALRKEVADVPEEILAELKPPAPEPQGDADAPAENADGEEAEGEPVADRGGFREPRSEDEGEGDADDSDEDADGDEPRKERPVYEPRPQRQGQEGRERPVYTPRNAGSGGGQKFNVNDALRQIEAHVQSLNRELASAQAKMRGREDDRRRRPEKTGPIVPGEPTPDELARLNVQLEARNAELQSQIQELTQHSEDMATSMGAMSGEPVSDTDAQLRTLLALKLQEDYADFIALEKESNDLVIQQHYKGLLRHVFEVLQQLDVALKSE